MKALHTPSLRTVNNVMTLIIIAICVYIMALPLLPQVSFWWKNGHTNKTPYNGKLEAVIGGKPDSGAKDTVTTNFPEENRIVIPALALNEKILEGVDPKTVNSGVWRRPLTSAPDLESNTVLVGHRFTYNGAAVFYSLDKLREGDKFAVYWKKVEYLYEVVSVKVVEPTAIEVESPSSAPTLTLYTCTPVWTAKNRLVVVSKLINKTENTAKEKQ
jgi:LPXTG-site transpeptidase (sortase) family protein